MRKAGKIPAVLYGHGQEAVNLAIDSKLVNKTVQAGQYIVTLSGAVNANGTRLERKFFIWTLLALMHPKRLK